MSQTLDSSRPGVVLASAEETAAFGARLAQRLRVGDAVLLFGPLGAGKTTLARGLISAWVGHEEDAPSPTYTLMQWYDGPQGPLAHLDLYRVRAPRELDELGLEEALEDALCVIEWPERLVGPPPRSRVEIHLEPAGDARLARIAAAGLAKERFHDF